MGLRDLIRAEKVYHEIDPRGHLAAQLTKLIEAIKAAGAGGSQRILEAINNLDRKVSELMATQEERLQAIAAKIDEVLADLAALKSNNPQIEDEIAAIEQKLSLTQPDTTGVITGDEANP